MKGCLIALGCFSALLLLLSIFVVDGLATSGVTSNVRASYYIATWPFIVAVGLPLLLTVVGLVVTRFTATMFWTTALLYCLLPFLLMFTFSRLPGDHNTEVGWVFFVGIPGLLVWAATIIILIARIVILLRRTRKADHIRGVDAP